MTTARELITGSFRLLGIYEAGENPSADEINDAASALNMLAQSLNLDNLISYQTVSETFTFVGNQGSYTFGAGGDFDVDPSPVEINNVTIRDIANALDLPCTIITDVDYSNIALKSVSSPIPFYVKIEQQSDNTKILTYWPVPANSSYGTTIYWQSYVPEFSLDTEIVLPPGYLRMLKYNLPIELAAEYGVSVSPEVAKIAADSLAAVKRQNTIFQTIGVDDAIPQGQSRYNQSYLNILTGN